MLARMSEQTYSDYLKLDQLLGLQEPLSEGPEHDELLFITIHQVYELWFKQVLHELEQLRSALSENRVAVILATFKRVLTILKTLVAQVDVLETMTPVTFASFRGRLEAASGLQSRQFREIEFVLGKRDGAEALPQAGESRARLEKRLGEPSLYDAYLRFVSASGYDVPRELLERERSLPPPEDPRVRESLLRIYREDATARQISERMVDLDEGLQEWRYRHVKMVERTIGTKRGTGGTSGVDYLRATLFQPLFPDLWTIRSAF